MTGHVCYMMKVSLTYMESWGLKIFVDETDPAVI